MSENRIGPVQAIGSTPFHTIDKAFDVQSRVLVTILGGIRHLLVTHGEIGHMWLGGFFDRLRSSGTVWNITPILTLGLCRGTFRHYLDLPLFVAKPWKRLRLEWGFLNEIKAAIPFVRQFEQDHPGVEVRLVQSVFTPNLLLFSPFLLGRRREVLQSMRDEIGRAHAYARQQGVKVVFQFELPPETVITWLVPRLLRQWVASRLMRGLITYVATLPEDLEYVVHACKGDLNGRHLARFRDTRVMVTLHNALVRVYLDAQTPQRLLGFQGPGPSDKFGPRLNWRPYRHLAKLHRCAGVTFSLGFVDECREKEELRPICWYFVYYAGKAGYRPTDLAISSDCGDGRVKPATAEWRFATRAELAVEFELAA